MQLPPLADSKTPSLLRQLTADAAVGGTSAWEAGAQSNFMITASRLGLRVASAANVGRDVYGDFLTGILKVSCTKHSSQTSWLVFSFTVKLKIYCLSCSEQEEGVQLVEPIASGRFEEDLRQTLLCFVLVDLAGNHSFCSRYDLGPWPLLPGVSHLPPGVTKVQAALSP